MSYQIRKDKGTLGGEPEEEVKKTHGGTLF